MAGGGLAGAGKAGLRSGKFRFICYEFTISQGAVSDGHTAVSADSNRPMSNFLVAFACSPFTFGCG
jgi:hypothetical protein